MRMGRKGLLLPSAICTALLLISGAVRGQGQDEASTVSSDTTEEPGQTPSDLRRDVPGIEDPSWTEGQGAARWSATAQSGRPSTNSDYVIGPEDVLDIDVFNVPELAKTVRVANDGTISLVLLGHVQAAGLSTKQLRERLEWQYGRSYLEKPQVSVFVKEFHAQPVSVIGAVEKPGLYQLTGPRTLIEMLSMAGGLAKRSSAVAGRTLYVTRKGGFSDFEPAEGMRLVASDKLEINIQKLLYSDKDVLNVPIQPLDIISVSKADIVYVVGAVRKPGGFVLEDREKITIMQALAMAEGLYGSPAKKSTRIIRRAQDGSREEIPVDLNKVLKGKANDLELAANDILFIPDSTAKVALKRGVEAAIATVSGLLIWRR